MDILGLLLGGLIGFVMSLVALVLGPTVEDRAQGYIVNIFGSTTPRRKLSLAGEWISRLHVHSNSYPPIVEDKTATIRQFGTRIIAKMRAHNFECYLIGKVEQGRTITGTWFDENGAGYYGAFQFLIDPSTGNFSGRWVGFSKEGIVKSGDWEWVRPSRDVVAASQVGEPAVGISVRNDL